VAAIRFALKPHGAFAMLHAFSGFGWPSCVVTDGPHHDSESDAVARGDIEADARSNCGERAVEFSWIAAIREDLPHKLLDGCEKRFVR
jgi:hypothetical protein